MEHKNEYQGLVEDLCIQPVDREYALTTVPPNAPASAPTSVAESTFTSVSGSGNAFADTERIADSEPSVSAKSATSSEFIDSGHLDSNWDIPVARKLHFDRKQILNSLYFGAAFLCLVIIIVSVRVPHGTLHFFRPLAWMIGLSLVSMHYLGLNLTFRRPKPSDYALTLPNSLSKALRATALILPIPLFVAAPLVIASHSAYLEGARLVTEDKFQQGSNYLTAATMLNPFNEPALAKMAYCQNCLWDYPKALEFANRALGLRRRDPDALADKAWALYSLGKFEEALPVAMRAARLNPEDGEMFALLANTYTSVGRFEAALDASSKHLELHSTEASAYRQHADILDNLGRSDEAKAMREKAESLSTN